MDVSQARMEGGWSCGQHVNRMAAMHAQYAEWESKVEKNDLLEAYLEDQKVLEIRVK